MSPPLSVGCGISVVWGVGLWVCHRVLSFEKKMARHKKMHRKMEHRLLQLMDLGSKSGGGGQCRATQRALLSAVDVPELRAGPPPVEAGNYGRQV